LMFLFWNEFTGCGARGSSISALFHLYCSNLSFLSYFHKVGLCDHHAVCVLVNPS
jgi:hypothetical protein